MKIFHVSNLSIWPLGKGKGIPSLFSPLKEFIRKGHEVHFLCPWMEGELKEERVDGIFVYRIDFPLNFREVHYVQRGNRFQRLLSSLRYFLNRIIFQVFALLRAIKIARKLRPDIIYAHTPLSAYVGYLVSKASGAALVIRLYGVFKMYPDRRKFWIKIKNFGDYFVLKLPAAQFIITNDGTRGDLLAREMGVPDQRVQYWRNGIDEKFFHYDSSAAAGIRGRYHIEPGVKLIVSTCRLIYDYGVDRLLESLAILFQKERKVCCLVAGSGPEQKSLEEIARYKGITERVIFTGIVDSDTIKKILDAGDIFVLLSRFHNLTNTLWEAMAAGKCLVTTEIAGITDILTSYENAVLIAQDKIAKLPEVLEHLLKDDALRLRLGGNAKRRAKEILETWPQRAEKEERLLEGLVKKD